eukprot:3057294-Rhodomonas_salina.3
MRGKQPCRAPQLEGWVDSRFAQLHNKGIAPCPNDSGCATLFASGLSITPRMSTCFKRCRVGERAGTYQGGRRMPRHCFRPHDRGQCSGCTAPLSSSVPIALPMNEEGSKASQPREASETNEKTGHKVCQETSQTAPTHRHLQPYPSAARASSWGLGPGQRGKTL